MSNCILAQLLDQEIREGVKTWSYSTLSTVKSPRKKENRGKQCRGVTDGHLLLHSVPLLTPQLDLTKY